MFSNISNKTLILVFGVLGVIVVAMYFFDAGKTERTFESELIDIDTAKVTKVVVFPKNSAFPIKIVKDNDVWKVELKNGKLAPGADTRIQSIFTQLTTIEPNRLAARGQNRFAEFQVDSAAAHVKVYEGSSEVADLILGKFSMDPATRQMSSFVRLADSEEIYEIKGFLSLSQDSDPNVFRNKKITEGSHSSWNGITFAYPADSSFAISKVSERWEMNGTKTDSVETVKFLRGLANLSGTSFVDDYNPEDIMTPTHTVTIDKEDGEIIIEGYEAGDNFYVRSTLNPESLFDGKANKLKEKIFIGSSKLLK
ncbi:MAG: hypothetical protein SCALA702_38400 [Melioribacteraceae bacterium]|nr:MAG: hypothetical protein SCALA702_38400 [Melioribacteraceae bacterium]